MATEGLQETIKGQSIGEPQEQGPSAQEPPSQRAVPLRMEAAKYAETVPTLRRPLFLKAAVGEASPRQAIKAKCQACVGYEDVTAAIQSCSVHACPLWAYRPYQQGETE